MASVFYAWELGANLGHLGTFLPVARELRTLGHDVRWAVVHTHQAAKLLPGDGFSWLQAPTLPEQRREGAPLNYADILLRFGYGDRDSLLGLTVAWRELLRLAAADIVLADHAPTAILAARTLDIPVMLFGSGFFAPPPVSPTPSMRPWLHVPAQRLAEADRAALDTMNQVLGEFGKAPLDRIADLFAVEEPSLLIFPELDHYPDRGGAGYWGTLPAAVAHPPQWPELPGSPGGGRKRVFAYLRPETPHLEAALQALAASPCAVLIYAPGLSPALRDRYARPGLRFSPVPVDLTTAAREADMAMTYASAAATIAFLLAGKPVVMIPGHLEQYLLARRVEEMGAGLLLNPEEPPAPLPGLLRRVLDDGRFAANAGLFAQKYARFDQREVMHNIVRRIATIATPAAGGAAP